MKHFLLLFFSFQLFPAHGWSQSLINFANPSARAAGLGNALSSAIHDPAAAFWNPASLGLIKDAQFRASASDPFSLSFLGLSYYFPGIGSFSFALTQFPSPRAQFDSLNVENDYLRRGIFGFGREITRYFYAGGAVHLNQFSNDSKLYTNLSFGLLAFPFSKNSDFKVLRIRESRWFNNVILPQKFALALTGQDISIGHNQLKAFGDISAFFRVFRNGTTLYTSFRFDDEIFLPRVGAAYPVRGYFNLVGGIEDFDIKRTAIGASFMSRHYSIDVTYSFEMKTVLADFAVRLGKSPSMRAKSFRAEGVRLYHRKRPRRALKALRKALIFVPDDTLSLALASRISEKIEEANGKIEFIFDAALKNEKKGWFIGAALNYEDIIALDRENKEAPKRLGAIDSLVEKNVAQLFAQSRKALAEDDLAASETAVSYILKVRSEHDGANRIRQQLRVRYGQESEKYFERGLGFYKQKKFQQARDNFEQALSYDEGHFEAKRYLELSRTSATAQAKQTHDLLGLAERHIRRGRFIDADNALVLALKADPDMYLAKQKRREIERGLSRQIQSLTQSGKRLLRRGDFDRATQRFRKLANHPRGESLAGRYLQRIKNLKEAMLSGIYQRAERHFNAGNWDEAIARCDSIATVAGNYRDVRKKRETALARLNIEGLYRNADRAFQTGNFLRALAYYRDIEKKEPGSSFCKQRISECDRRLAIQVEDDFSRGISEFIEENYQAALFYFKRVLRIDSTHSQALDYKARSEQNHLALLKLRGEKI